MKIAVLVMVISLIVTAVPAFGAQLVRKTEAGREKTIFQGIGDAISNDEVTVFQECSDGINKEPNLARNASLRGNKAEIRRRRDTL